MKTIPSKRLLSLVIPSYKDEKIIVPHIKKLIAVLDTIRFDYEIIVVIDGIFDKSFELLKKAKFRKTTVLAYPNNQGKSFALRLGTRFAEGDYVMFLDCGDEIDPSGISMLLEHIEWYEADIVVGSKRHPASIVNYSLLRRILSEGYYFGVRLLFGVQVKDTQAGIKVFRRDVVRKIFPLLVEKRFTGDLEILVVAQRHGFKKIFEAPIKLNYDFEGISSAANVRTIWGMIIDTLAIFYRDKILNYYSKSVAGTRIPSNMKTIIGKN